MVFQVIEQVSKEVIVSAFKLEKYKTDNLVFRLHYKVTTYFIILYAICYMYVQIESPISCISGKGVLGDSATRKVLNDFCWVHGTYSITSHSGKGPDLFPGVRSLVGDDEEVFSHEYYKWMYFYIVLMLILIQIPRQLWRTIEAGRMKAIATTIKWHHLAPTEEVAEQEQKLVDYMFSHLGYHGKYSWGYVGCEVLNVIVSSFLLFMWDMLSGYHLSVYGWSNFTFLRIPPTDRVDFLAKVFPLLSKCTFRMYGPSGTVEIRDVMCVLPLNVVNERAAVFFWCYFMILIIIGVIQLVVRFILVFSKRLRAIVIRDSAPLLSSEEVSILVNSCAYPDWFFMKQLCANLDDVMYRQILKKFAEKIRIKGREGEGIEEIA